MPKQTFQYSVEDYRRKVKLHHEFVYDKVVHLVPEPTFKGSDVVFEWLPMRIQSAKKMLIV